jgi:4-carboxymuconolactone decarboxylase
MARIKGADGGGEIAERIRRRRGGRRHALDVVLLHSPPVADGWNTLLGAIREETTVPGDVRELVILRVAALNHAQYEWRAHEPVARRCGLGDAQIDAVRDEGDRSALRRDQRVALDYTDAMTRDMRVPAGVFDAVSRQFAERQVVELTATVAAYNLVSRFLVALEIGEPEAAGEPSQ